MKMMREESSQSLPSCFFFLNCFPLSFRIRGTRASGESRTELQGPCRQIKSTRSGNNYLWNRVPGASPYFQQWKIPGLL